MLDLLHPDLHTLHACLYAALGGTIGAQSVLFGKTLAELLKSIGAALASYQFYFILVAMAVCLNLQLRYLNLGFSALPSLTHGPSPA